MLGYLKRGGWYHCDHVWAPIIDPSKLPREWLWECHACHNFQYGTPSGISPHIEVPVLHRMVDTSLRTADRVICDNQSLKGELWTMRNSHWEYRPFQFQIVYHTVDEYAFVLLFRYAQINGNNWQTVHDTEKYRDLLWAADNWRRQQP